MDSQVDDLRCDVLVVGGGVTGCAATYHLNQLGADVMLCERSDLNTQASGRNAGSLHGQIQYPSFAERGTEWAYGFLPALRFLTQSLGLWESLSSELGVDLEVSLKGGLLIADSSAQMRAIENKVAIESKEGVESQILGVSDLQRLAPYVSTEMVGAQLCLREGKANPLLVAPAFAAAARSRGARILTNIEVLNIQPVGECYRVRTSAQSIWAKRIVFATGNSINKCSAVWTSRSLPIADEPVQVSATEPLPSMVPHLVYYAGGKLTLKQAKAGTLLIGGGWAAGSDSQTGEPRVDASSLSANMEIALRVVPSLAGVRVIRTWAGIGLATPDLAPIIGRVGPGLFVGLYPHMGLTAGPLLGLVLAQLALDRQTEVDIEPFSPNRF